MRFQLLPIKRKQNFLNVLVLAILTLIGGCQKAENPVLGKMDGNVVLEKEYVEHYLLSTQYKPDVFPTEENLKDIVTLKALDKMALSEAQSLQLDQDSSCQAMVFKNENRLLFYRYMRQEIIDKIITDSLIQKFYQEFSPQYQMRYIMRPVLKTTLPEVAKTQKDTIEYVYRLLRSGKNFENLAKRYSQDYTTKDKGGDLGFVIRESLGDAQLRAVMDTLPQFKYSAPVRGYEGYYIMFKGEKREVPVPEFDQVKSQIWNTLYRTRRHLISNAVDAQFQALASAYHYQINEDVIDGIKATFGIKDAAAEFKPVDFHKLTVADMNKVLARYDQGVISVFDLFRNRKRAPQTISDLREMLKQLSQQAVLAERARELEYKNIPELAQQIDEMKTEVLRAAVYENQVNVKARAVTDSLEKAGVKEKFGYVKVQQKIKMEFEEQLKEKYHFKYVTGNFSQALKAARKLKEQQNLERKASDADIPPEN